LANIVYFLASAVTPRDLRRFGVSYFAARGFAVTILEAAAICHPRVTQQKSEPVEFSGVTIRTIGNRAGLVAERTTLALADVIMCFVTDGLVTPDNHPILRMIAESGRPYVLLRVNAIPGIDLETGSKRSLTGKITNLVDRLKGAKPIHSAYARLPLKTLGLRPANFVIFGGSKSQRQHGVITGATEVIQGHAQDYDIAIESGIDIPAVDKTAVFLDQYLPHHRDWAVIKGFAGFDVAAYYRGLNGLFSRIEKELGLQVIIAAHPRADYHDKPDVFKGREIVFNQTVELVRRSQLCITFSSLALNYAVIYGKPIMLATTREYYNHPVGRRFLDPLSHELGRDLIFLENVEKADLTTALNIDSRRWSRYLAKYIKDPMAPARPLWEIVQSALNARGVL
jgi:hypothetical protein